MTSVWCAETDKGRARRQTDEQQATVRATSERGWRSAHETGATADSRTGRKDSTSRRPSAVSDVRARVGGAVDERAELVALERLRASRPGGGRARANERCSGPPGAVSRDQVEDERWPSAVSDVRARVGDAADGCAERVALERQQYFTSQSLAVRGWITLPTSPPRWSRVRCASSARC